jgi:hypothetical protein
LLSSSAGLGYTSGDFSSFSPDTLLNSSDKSRLTEFLSFFSAVSSFFSVVSLMVSKSFFFASPDENSWFSYDSDSLMVSRLTLYLDMSSAADLDKAFLLLV